MQALTTTTLGEWVKRPRKPLSKAIRQCSDIEALAALINRLDVVRRQGLHATLHHLTYRDLSELVAEAEDRMGWVGREGVRTRRRNRAALYAQPYLDESLRHHDPRKRNGQAEKEESRRDSGRGQGQAGDPGGSGGRRQRRQRRRFDD